MIRVGYRMSSFVQSAGIILFTNAHFGVILPQETVAHSETGEIRRAILWTFHTIRERDTCKLNVENDRSSLSRVESRISENYRFFFV